MMDSRIGEALVAAGYLTDQHETALAPARYSFQTMRDQCQSGTAGGNVAPVGDGIEDRTPVCHIARSDGPHVDRVLEIAKAKIVSTHGGIENGRGLGNCS